MSPARRTHVFLGPAALAAGLAFAGWIALRPRAETELQLPRLGAAAPRTIDGLAGAAPSMTARLAPMHADPRRQAFEARALRTRFARPDGEPFRLELRRAEGSSAARVDLDACRVVDARGEALLPLVRAADLHRAVNAPVDPLRALLAAGPVELASGGSACVVLWGRLPDDGARLVLDGGVECALAPERWSSDPLEDVLARRPAPAAEEAGR